MVPFVMYVHTHASAYNMCTHVSASPRFATDAGFVMFLQAADDEVATTAAAVSLDPPQLAGPCGVTTVSSCALQPELDAVKAAKEQLQQQWQEAAAIVQEMEQRLAAAKADRGAALQQLNSGKETEALTGELAALIAEQRKTQQQLTQGMAGTQALMWQAEAAAREQQELVKQLQAASDAGRTAAAETASLLKQLQAKEAEVQDLQQRLTKAAAQQELMRQEAAVAKEQLLAQQHEVGLLQQELAQKAASVQASQQQAEAAVSNKQVPAAYDLGGAAAAMTAQLQQQLQVATAEAEDLRQQLARGAAQQGQLRHELAAAQGQLATRQREVKLLQQELAQKAASLQAAQQQNEAAAQVEQELINQVHAAAEAGRTAAEDAALLQKELQAKADERGNLMQQLAKAAAQQEALMQEVAAAKGQLAGMQHEVKVLQEQLTKAKALPDRLGVTLVTALSSNNKQQVVAAAAALKHLSGAVAHGQTLVGQLPKAIESLVGLLASRRPAMVQQAAVEALHCLTAGHAPNQERLRQAVGGREDVILQLVMCLGPTTQPAAQELLGLLGVPAHEVSWLKFPKADRIGLY
jgi:chromosome segregation ATPase